MTPTITPNPKQHEAWQRLQDSITDDVVFGGAAGGGKSWLGVEWLLTCCFFFPGTRWFIGRDSLKSIRESTIITWFKMLQHHKLKMEAFAKYNGQDHYIIFNNGSRIDLLDMGYYPADPMFERFGSKEYTGGWIEEAGEVNDLAVTIIRTRIGRMYNDKYKLRGKLLLTCNPKKNFLYREYYKPWKNGTLPENKAFIQSFVGDNDKIDSQYVERLKQLTGSQRQRLLLGDWEYENDPSALIAYEKILDVFTNDHVPTGKKYITADIARLGGDRIVQISWDGFRGDVQAWSKAKLTTTTTNIEAARHRLQVGKSDVLVDSDGIGGGVEDFGGYKGFVNNSRPLPDPDKPYTEEGKENIENYDNLKSQCGFRMATRISNSGLYLTCEEWMRPLIIEELEWVKQKDMDKEAKKGLLPKDKVKEGIGRSPDFWDAILMREYFDLKPIFGVIAA